jgi:hypothetical protein
MRSIYEFKRADGSVWADFSLPDSDVTILNEWTVDTWEEINDVIHSTTGRVQALAERALNEKLAETPRLDPTPVTEDRGFLGRLKYLFTGK